MVREMTSYSYCAALRALRPGFYPVFREQSGCSPSVVAVVGRCNGIMSNPNANPYQPQPQPGPQKNKTSRRFFTWVRSSGLVRGDDRWINRDSRCGVGLYCARRLSALVVGQKRHSPAGRVRIRGICAATGFTACVISSSTACLISSRATSTSISFVFSSATFSTTCFTTCFTNRA